MRMPMERAKKPSSTTTHAKRKPTIVIACFISLVLVLVGASLFWALRTKSIQSATKAPVLATATAFPTWTPTPITPPAGSLFYDTFADNSHGWSVSGEAGYYRILVDNLLILADTHPDTFLVEPVPTENLELKDYVVNVDFTINQGDQDDSTGIYLRGDSVLDHDYRVDINSNGTIDVVKEWLGAEQTPQTTLLVPPQASPFLRPPGKSNQLSVIMLGPTITVSINNVVVTMISDSSYASGQVALFAHAGTISTAGIVVSFTKVEIDELTSPLLTPTPISSAPDN
jgi:hypothetical protein